MNVVVNFYLVYEFRCIGPTSFFLVSRNLAFGISEQVSGSLKGPVKITVMKIRNRRQSNSNIFLSENMVSHDSHESNQEKWCIGTQPNLRQPVTNLASHLEEFVHSIDKHHYKSDDLLRCRVW